MNETGLDNRYIVRRVDGRDGPGDKHEGCPCFVLDIKHDPIARAALMTYADRCRRQYPQLAEDLYALVRAHS